MRVHIHGFKGLDEVQEFDRRTLLVGPNGCGKSARMQALQWAMYGRVGDRKTLESLVALSPDGMGMSVAVDTGRISWKRSIEKDGNKGSLSQSLTIAGAESLKLAEAEAELAKHLGDFTAHLNLNEFTSLSPDGRRKFIMSLCAQAGGGSTDGMMSRLEIALLNEVLGKGAVQTTCHAVFGKSADDLDDGERQVAIDKLWAATDGMRQVFDGMRQAFDDGLSAGDPVGTIAAWTDTAKDLRSAHRAARDTAHAASQKLAQARSGLVATSEHVAELREQAKQVRGRLSEIATTIGEIRARHAAKEGVIRSVDRARQQLASTEERLASVARAERRDWRREMEEIDQKIREIETGDASDAAIKESREITARLQKARLDARAMGDEIASALASIHANEIEIGGIRRAIAKLVTAPWVVAAELVEKIRPHVHGGDGDFDELATLVGAQAKADRDELDRCEFDLAVIEGEQQAASERHASLSAAMAEHESLIRQLEGRQAELQEIVNKARSLDEQVRILATQRTRIERESDRAKADLESAQEAVARARTVFAEAEALLATLGDVGDSGELVIEQTKYQTQLDEIEAKIEAKERFESLSSELAACIAKGKAESAAYDMVGMVQDAIKAVREVIMDDMVRPLLDTVDEFLRLAGVERSAYCTLANGRGKAIFDLGWVVDVDGLERRISLDTMSGGESALFGAALAYAMLKAANQPSKVLCIEADSIDTNTIDKLLVGFGGVNDLDHVIVATCHKVPLIADGWNLVELDCGAGVMA